MYKKIKFWYYNRLYLFWIAQATIHNKNLSKKNGESSQEDFEYALRKGAEQLLKLAGVYNEV